MNPIQQQILNTIAQGEAPDYNTLYGGHKITDLSTHPAIPIPIGKTGQTTTAAGRYQILKSTWDRAAQALGLKDFRPDSQDEAAWWIAQQDYQKATGRDLQGDAASGQVQWSALTNQWPSLRRLLPRSQAPNAAGLSSQLPEFKAASQGPQILNQLSSYSPLSGASLIPVDHDPFGGQ